MNDTDLAYLAGYFDGEGGVNIARCRSNISRFKLRGKIPKLSHWILASITNTDPRVLLQLKDNFGGSIVITKHDLRPKWRASMTWSVAGSKAYVFLKAIAPFLRQKKEQAEIAISFHELKQICRGKHNPVTDEQMKWREENAERIMALNKHHWIEKSAACSQ